MLNRLKSRKMSEVSEEIRKAGIEPNKPKPLEEDQEDGTNSERIEEEPSYPDPKKKTPEEMQKRPESIIDPDDINDNSIEDKQKAIEQASPGESVGKPVG